MEEEQVIHEDEVRLDDQVLDIVLWEELTSLQSDEPSQPSYKKDASSMNPNENDCREIVMDYSNEFTTYEVFKSKEAMTNWVREVGRINGFVIIIASAQPAARGRKAAIVYNCERSGKYRGHKKHDEVEIEGKENRMTGTKKCDCPFRLRGMKSNDQIDEWTLCVKSGVHNHPAAKHFEGHTYAGRLDEEEKNLVKELSINLCRPRDILRTLKTRKETNTSTMKHVYNARHRLKVLDMGKRSQMQYLFGLLDEHKYIEYHRCFGVNDELTDMFWTHPDCIRLLRTFPTVLIMDCTYKTNKFRLPLLEIVGETSTGKTFMVALAYLKSERTDNYDWVMGRLKDVMNDDIELPKVVITDREWALMSAVHTAFPDAKQMLCVWHINKNVGAACKIHFHVGQGKQRDKFLEMWNLLIKSPTEGDYQTNLNNFKCRFSCFQPAVDYVINSWLGPYHEWFVDAWTDKYMHLGNKTTNRAESQHAKLKRQLQSSQGNFATCFRNIHALTMALHNDINESFERSIHVVQHVYKPTEFKELRGFISIHALDLILDSCGHANYVSHTDEDRCQCSKRMTHGLPCGHEVARYRKECRPIPLRSIHPHWMKLAIDVYKPCMETLCNSAIRLFERKFHASDENHRQTLIKKIRDITAPDTTSLIEPEVKTDNKGRPQNSKADTSTRRDPSKFEHVLSGEDDLLILDPANIFIVPPTRKRCKGRGRGRGRGKVHVTRSCKRDYIDQIKVSLRPYISSVKDVQSDGHCGFRAIAALMGFGEDQWSKVRKDMLKELRTYPKQYELVFKRRGRVAEIERVLDHFEEVAPYDYWFTMPDMGYIVASCYGCVVYSLAPYLSLTFMPLRTPPVDLKHRKEIAIGFVNGNHYVQVFFKSGHPVPPVAAPWIEHCQQIARGWETPYLDRIDTFKSLVDREIYSQ